jgi:hypothetical protein
VRLRGPIALAAVLAVLVPASSTATVEYPERLLITADEWDLALSRTKLDPGNAIFELHNRGEDAHDVKIKRRGHRNVAAIPETGSGETTRIETTLRRDSRYVLWCSLEGHRGLGMEAELRTAKG